MMKDSCSFLPGGPRFDCLTIPLALLGVYIPLSVLLIINFFLGCWFLKNVLDRSLGIKQL